MSVVSHCRVFIEHDFPYATILHALEATRLLVVLLLLMLGSPKNILQLRETSVHILPPSKGSHDALKYENIANFSENLIKYLVFVSTKQVR